MGIDIYEQKGTDDQLWSNIDLMSIFFHFLIRGRNSKRKSTGSQGWTRHLFNPVKRS
mgnify:CR=1 FL=1